MVNKDNSFELLTELFSHKNEIVLKKHEYLIESEKENIFEFYDKDNITIDGSNSVLSFGGKVRPFVFNNCTNIVIKNITIDYWNPPYTHGEILDSDGQSFTVRLTDRLSENMPSIQAFTEYDKDTLAPRKEGNDIYWDCKNIEIIDNTTVRVEFNNRHSVPPIGTLVVMRHEIYDYDGFTFYDCKNIVFENVKIRCSVGMGVCAYNSEDLKFINIEIAPEKKSKRLMSTSGDGIHLMNCAGNVLVKDCYFAYLGDDSFNSHGMFLKVTEIENNIIKARHPKEYNLLPHIGDRVEYTQAGTMLAYGSAVIKSAKLVGNEVVLEVESSEGKQLQIGDYIANATRNVQLTYCNNIVENKRCRGVLVQTRGAIIRDNVFRNVSGGGILVFCEDISFFESIGTQNIVIENNRFINNNNATGKCQGDISVVSYTDGYKLGGIGVHKNITIKNNVIENTGYRGIYIACAKNVVVEDNIIGLSNDVSKEVSAIKIEHSENVIVSNNCLEGENKCNVIIEIGDECKNISTEYKEVKI